MTRLAAIECYRAAVLHELEQIAQIVQQRLEQNSTKGRTLTLKIKFSDYQCDLNDNLAKRSRNTSLCMSLKG
ncbi:MULTISPECIES: hypothetical protein [Nostoc]|uniref:DNA polymerase Y-family little finger domain-containing protein n=1 Tax=Nostoc paludosum FACHB-159 TaxID=2692908 RepID=A0ABR8KK64_9NOSO|nr:MULTISPECIES: hypothetical protein [Nostoc]MBD2683511.1 hypothetical protein [Nostoc sp. FACHB-857]MBD2739926.1 hypothetical protein [Nostoc paludosum FACHB-159]